MRKKHPDSASGDVLGCYLLADSTNSRTCRPHSKAAAVSQRPGPGEIQADETDSRHTDTRETGSSNLSEEQSHASHWVRNFENYRIRALLYASKPNWRVLGSIVAR